MSEQTELSQAQAGAVRGDSGGSELDNTAGRLRSGKKRSQLDPPEGEASSQRSRTDQPGGPGVGSPRSISTVEKQTSETVPLVMDSREQEELQDIFVEEVNTDNNGEPAKGEEASAKATNYSPVIISEKMMPKSMDASAVIHLELQKLESVSQVRKLLRKMEGLVTDLEGLQRELVSNENEKDSVGSGIEEDLDATKADLRKVFAKAEEKNIEQEGRSTEFIKICKYIERAATRDGKKPDERAKKKCQESEETQDDLSEKMMEFQRKNRKWLRNPKTVTQSVQNSVEPSSQANSGQLNKLLDSISQALKPSIVLTEASSLKEKTEFLAQCEKFFNHHQKTIQEARNTNIISDIFLSFVDTTMQEKLLEVENFRTFNFKRIKEAVENVFLLIHPLYIRRVGLLDEKMKPGEAPVEYFERLQTSYVEAELETAPPQVTFLTLFIAGLPISGDHAYARKEMMSLMEKHQNEESLDVRIFKNKLRESEAMMAALEHQRFPQGGNKSVLSVKQKEENPEGTNPGAIFHKFCKKWHLRGQCNIKQ